MKKILIPVDFSEESLNALNAAHSLAEVADSEILVLHVVEDPNIQSLKMTGEVHYDPMENLYVKLLLKKTKEKLEALVNDPKFNTISISYKIDIGNAYSSIVEHIENQNASLIIMGTKGVSGLQEILVGSVADKVSRHASCPMIIVKGECQLKETKHIVYATNLKDDEKLVISELQKLQAHYGAHIHVVFVSGTVQTTLGEMKEEVQGFIDRMDIPDSSTAVIKNDDIAEAILDYAQENGCALVAFGTHDRNGLLHLLASHVSRNIINHGNRTIWSMAIR